jgi:hypothetical protein
MLVTKIKISAEWKNEVMKKIYCPNFFLVLERYGFPLCSMSTLGTVL